MEPVRVTWFSGTSQKDKSRCGRRQLDADITKLAALLGQRNGNPQEIAATATAPRPLAGQFAQQLNAETYDQAFTLAVMRSIAQDGDSISLQGQRAAEQAAMSLDSLFAAYKQNSEERERCGDSRIASTAFSSKSTIRPPTTRLALPPRCRR